MKKRFILSFDEFVNSEYYKEYEKEKSHIMSFDEFVNSINAGQTVQFIAMTYDLSKAKSRDYRQLSRFLSQLGFLKQINGRPMPKNTFILPGKTQNLTGLMNSIVNFINTTGKRHKVFGCITSTYDLRP